jgi:dipeptidyl aminopeptidase/acylaminoacyl peptidase
MKPTNGIRRAMRGAAVIFAAVCSTGQASPPSAEDFARRPAIHSVKLSPSGKRLALLVSSQQGRNALAVMDLPLGQPPRAVAAYRDAEITSFAWVNDDRLLYDAVDFEDGVEVRTDRAGTFAVDHDGESVVQLIAHRHYNDSTTSRVQSRVLTWQWNWLRTIDDGGNDIWVYERVFDNRDQPTGFALARMNTRNGHLRKYVAGTPQHTWGWLFGPNGEPAVAKTEWDGRTKLHHRDSPDQPWATLRDEATVGGREFSPAHLHTDGRLIVTARNGGDTSSLYDLDLRTGQLSQEPLVAVKGFDLNPGVVLDTSTRKLMGIHFRTDRPYTYWFDDGLHTIQQGLDAALPGRFNEIDCARCESARHMVVRSWSDAHPGEFLLYNRQTRKLEPIGMARPWLQEATQGKRSFHRFESRDGLEVPVYVTHPPGSKPTDTLPAVVLVHGGPWVRGVDRGWDTEAQFLASRGYRVLEPEFRGSTGYGSRLFSAGFKQWGGAMQDDLADTVDWAAKRGLIDEKRVCIMGASYGGYAALMSPIRHPTVYQCAVAFAAVTDMELRYTAWDSDLNDQTARHVLPAMMGDPEKDRDLLRAASPLLRVKELRIPVLLMHGAKDRRVPIEHAARFASVAKATGVPIDYHVYDVEGHGFVLEADEADYFRRVEAFLAKHLGRPAGAR